MINSTKSVSLKVSLVLLLALSFCVLSARAALATEGVISSTLQTDNQLQANSQLEPEDLVDNGIPLTEIEGSDRFETAVKVSQMTYPDVYPAQGSTQGVIIASGFSFADALAASSIAGIMDYPILLTKPDTLPEVTRAELVRLGVQKAIIVGGEAVVSKQVAIQLTELLGLASVTRLSGSDRYATAEQIFDQMSVSENPFGDTLIIATGVDFADSAAIAPFAAAQKAPVLLAQPNGGLTVATKAIIESNPGFTKAIIVGGTTRIGPDTQAYLEGVFSSRLQADAEPDSQQSGEEPVSDPAFATVPGDPNAVIRLAGTNRYETSRVIADYLVDSDCFSFDTTAIASGFSINFPDALTSASYLSKNGIPLLLANAPDSCRSVLSQFASEDLCSQGVVFGGISAVPQLVRLELRYGPLPLNDTQVTVASKFNVQAGTPAYSAPVTSSFEVMNWTAAATLFAIPYDAAGNWYQVGFGKDILFYRAQDVTQISKVGAIVDLSRWNSDYVTEAAYSNIELAILQTNHGVEDLDITLASYVRYAAGCNRHGVPYGAYTYVTYSSADEARAEAIRFYTLANTSGCYPKFYVADIESLPDDWGSQPQSNMRVYTAAFLTQLRSLGAQKVGIYIGHHRYVDFAIDYDAFDFVWIPRYGDNTGYMDVEPAFPFDIWQYTSKGQVEGMQYPNGSYGYVDLNAINDRGPNSRQLSWYTQ